MDISKEKEYIYSLMKDITEERRRLTDMYYSLKERLDDLSRLEEQGLNNLSVKGYVELHNDINKNRAIENIKRESSNTIKRIRDDYSKSKENKTERERSLSKSIEKEKIDKPVKSRRVSFERMVSVVSNILIEQGTPMSLGDIYKKVNDEFGEGVVNRKNFSNNIMYRMANSNKTKIEKAGHGMYQYRM